MPSASPQYCVDTESLRTVTAGLLSIGYAVAIIAFIRVGVRLLRRFGPRKPMIWAAMIVALSSILLMPTNILVGPYTVLAVIAYRPYGVTDR